MLGEHMSRPTKTEYYLDIARAVAQRSTCLRRRVGAVIIREDQIISTGYAGAPRGTPNCIDLGYCAREAANIPSGERYELCRSVHAEANAIINAARAGTIVLNGTMYIHVENIDGSIPETANSCLMCQRMIINAGLLNVIIRRPQEYWDIPVKDWVNQEFQAFQESIKNFKTG
jgi:dCMP deaminase